MKNLKRLMSVVLSVVMLLSMVISTSAATFTDVAESDKAFEAVEILAALKILEGKEAGVFDPDANIKRSEFAAVICRAMNQSPVGVASFTDVAADHWAYNYIAWAASQKIVNGRGDGTFDPDANVTYNEAITMIVRAMGYEYYVEEYLGGFPTGYARVAGSYKIDAGVNTANGNAAATRADVATLVYNAFSAPLMDYNYAIGADMEYVIYNGSRNVEYEKRTLLSYYSEIYKFKATVDDTFKTVSNYVDNKGNKKMDLTILSTYGFEASWIEDALGQEIVKDDEITVIANDEAWAAYAGYTVDAYIALNDAEKLEVVAMVPVSSGDELVIDNAREMINDSEVTTEVAFEYEDENGRKQTPKIAVTATVYVNDRNLGAVNTDTKGAKTAFESLEDGAFASVTLRDADNDGTFDAIYLTSYIYGIVEEVDADYEVIELTNGDVLELSEDDVDAGEDFVYTIYKDGAEIAIEDLVAGDLLNIVVGADDYDDITAIPDATFVDIYVTNNTIESSVSSVAEIDGVERFAIDGENYYLADNAKVTSLNPGDTGIFYITIDGFIYDADFTSTHSDNYGVILEMGDNPSAFGTTWEIKILDKNNNVNVYPVKNSMFITDEDAEILDFDDDDDEGTPAIAQYTRRQYKSTASGELALDDKMGEIEALIDAANSDTDLDDLAAAQINRLVTFKVVNNEITELVFAVDSSDSENDRDFIVDELDGDYKSRTGRLAGMELIDSTVLFSVPVEGLTAVAGTYSVDLDVIQVFSQSALVNDDDYAGFIYNYDDRTNAFGAALLTDDMGFAGNENALAVVMSNSQGLDANGNTTNVITFMQAGETKSLALADTYKAVGGYDLEDAAIGDVFQYTTNAAGEIAMSEGIFVFADRELIEEGTADEIGYIAGVVVGNTNKVVNFANEEGEFDAAWELAEDGTNVLFEVARAGKSNAFADKNGSSYIRAAREEADETFGSDAYMIVAKTDDGAIVDVVAYLYDKDAVDATEIADFADLILVP